MSGKSTPSDAVNLSNSSPNAPSASHVEERLFVDFTFAVLDVVREDGPVKLEVEKDHPEARIQHDA
jgi:hypothetical protein